MRFPSTSFAVSSSTAVDIPDGSGSATATATILGFTRPLANIQAWVAINHPSPQQLRLTLIGPDGTSVVLRNQTGQDEHPINAIYGKTDPTAQSLAAFAGKTANGTWTLKVEGSRDGNDRKDQGLRRDGHRPPAETVHLEEDRLGPASPPRSESAPVARSGDAIFVIAG